jgi:UDP-3-O-[3-hydroxymyristoyl] glucosamine N-acyltransferase
MRLSDIPELARALRRDGEFASLGFVTHRAPAMLVYAEHPRFLAALASNPDVACAITTEALADGIPAHLGLACVEEPRRAFYGLHNRLARETEFYGAPFANAIAASARIHPTAFVAATSVRIGERVLVEPHATIFENAIVGDDAIVRAGCVVSSAGFEFNALGDGMQGVVHAGGVRLGARVELQSNSCVDRAVFGGFTEIGDDTKVDKLALVGHNARVGARCRIAAGAVIAGSATLGDGVWVGPNAAVANEVTVGAGARVSIGAVVTRDVAPGVTVTGNFAIDHDRFLEQLRRVR